jgi:acyl-coenzyme A synthetase/AMP-(fatty) acid ligase
MSLPQLPAISAQQIAAIAFTSGSTGTPTANTKYWGTLAATSRLLAERFFSAEGTPSIVATVPSQHMYGLEMTVMMALQGGAILNAAKPFYPADISAALAESAAPVILVSAPVHLRAAVNAELAMPEISTIVSATAPLDKSLAHAAENIFGAKLFEIYGCTEAGSMATRASTQTDTWRLLQGFSLVQEKESFFARAPHLGEIAPIQDVLQLQNDTDFLLLGRNADMINVAGKRASLANLSLELLKVDGVIDGVIFLPPVISHISSPASVQHEQRPVGLVVSNLPEKEILVRLAQRIDATFLPRPLRKVNSLPRNETGKLTQSALHAMWSQLHEQ